MFKPPDDGSGSAENFAAKNNAEVGGNSEQPPSPDSESEDSFSLHQPPSAVALKLRKLKSASFKAAQARERLPHPLFWSLFLTEVSELRKKKEEKRLLDRVLLGVGTD